MKRVGFIGVGIMGSSMVRNLMKDGHEVHIYARNKEKVEQVIADGAVFHDTIAECVKGRDAVITIVGYPQDVEDVYLGEDKILESADPGTYLIDMTTTSPSLDAQLAKEAAEKGLKMLDAPVTGGDYGARSGTLSILVGGAKEAYEACLDLFSSMGKNITWYGPSGCGQHAKLANQIMQAGITYEHKLPKVFWKCDFWSAEFYAFCLCHRYALCLSFSNVLPFILCDKR